MANESAEMQKENISPPSQPNDKSLTDLDSIQEKRKSRKYAWKLNACLWLPFFLANLDLTIVATALPEITNYFGAFNQYNWGVTAFTLTSTAFLPIFGQLATTFGRHLSLQSAIISLTLGSILCAAAPIWSIFLLGRAFQGLGTAGITNVVMIILADNVSLKEHAKNVSIFQVLSGIGYAVGPVIGGYLTNSNWRYCFVLPAAVGALSIGTVFLLRKELVDGTVRISKPLDGKTRAQTFVAGIKSIDFGGASLFVVAFALIILGTAWGGSTYAWNSAAVIAPIVIGAVLLPIFVLYEYMLEPGRAMAKLSPQTTPMIPMAVLRNKDVAIVCVSAAGLGAALYSLFYFVGIYFALVENYEAGRAGLQLLYYIPGLGVGVYAAIFLVNKWPRQTFLPLFAGTVLETAGVATLTYAIKAQDKTLVSVTMALSGVGSGLRLMPSNLHLAGMLRDHLAPAYSMLRFSQPFGGTLALAIMGAVFQNKLSADFSGLGDQLQDVSVSNSAALTALSTLPQAQQIEVRNQAADAIMWAYISIMPFLGLSMLASLFLGNVWIPKAKTSSEKVDEVVEAGHSQIETKDRVCRGAYLFQQGRHIEKGHSDTGDL